MKLTEIMYNPMDNFQRLGPKIMGIGKDENDDWIKRGVGYNKDSLVRAIEANWPAQQTEEPKEVSDAFWRVSGVYI